MNEKPDKIEPTMRLAMILAVISGVVLALFILIRPVIGRIGSPTAPETGGLKQGPFGTTSDTPSIRLSARTLPGRSGVVNLDNVEAMIVQMTNQARQDSGRAALADEGTLRDIAREHSTDMIARAFFSHDNPDGHAPGDRIAMQHRQLIGVGGENIAKIINADPSMSDRAIAEQLVTMWMNSPGHRANIVRRDFTHLGVGVSRKGNDILATQNFAGVQAFLGQPVPSELYRGDRLVLTPNAFPTSGTKPTQYDYWSSEDGLPVSGRLSIDAAPTIDVPPGIYKLRFYFPYSGGYLISVGPQVEVKSR